MTRVTVAAALALALLAAPLAAEAQQTGKVYRIAYLGGSDQAAPLVESLRAGLRDLGYVEGRNLVLEVRWGGASPDRQLALASELVSLRLDVLVAGLEESIRAATRAVLMTSAPHRSPPARPDAPHTLVIVQRGRAGVYETLTDEFEHLDRQAGVRVVWDRRVQERRRRAEPSRPERRRDERCQPPPATWTTLGVLLVEGAPPEGAASHDEDP